MRGVLKVWFYTIPHPNDYRGAIVKADASCWGNTWSLGVDVVIAKQYVCKHTIDELNILYATLDAYVTLLLQTPFACCEWSNAAMCDPLTVDEDDIASSNYVYCPLISSHKGTVGKGDVAAVG